MGTPYLGEIKIISWGYNPKSWAFANGQFLPINQNQALFSLFGTSYGGNGQTTFALPNLQGNVPIHMGSGFVTGQKGGENAHTLILGEMPTHNHFLVADANTVATSNSATAAANGSIGQTIGAPSTGASFPISLYTAGISNLTQQASQEIGNFGGNQAHENRQPYLCLNMIVALQGVFPSRN